MAHPHTTPAAILSTQRARGRAQQLEALPGSAPALLTPTIAACLRKEWVYLRGNSNQLIQMITPLVFVFIFAKGILLAILPTCSPERLATRCSACSARSTTSSARTPRVYNSICSRRLACATSSSPRTSRVLRCCWWKPCSRGKIVMVLATVPIALSSQFSAAFWIIFIIFTNLTFGTLRSIQAPRKFVPGQARQMRTTGARARPAISLVFPILLGSLLLQAPVTLLSSYLNYAWLSVWIFAPLAIAAVGAYALLLKTLTGSSLPTAICSLKNCAATECDPGTDL